MGDDYDSKLLSSYKKEDKYFELWNKYFKLNKRVFKKGKKYKFSYMVRTDGISCCILFIRVDKNGKPLSKKTINIKQEENIDYIEKTNIKDIKDKKIVCADPGMSDLIYCGSYDENNKLTSVILANNNFTTSVLLFPDAYIKVVSPSIV
jgi:hypothetical protein